MEEEDLNALRGFKDEAFKNAGDLERVSRAIIDRQKEIEKVNDEKDQNSNDLRELEDEDEGR